jgi:hypothetical protein
VHSPSPAPQPAPLRPGQRAAKPADRWYIQDRNTYTIISASFSTMAEAAAARTQMERSGHYDAIPLWIVRDPDDAAGRAALRAGSRGGGRGWRR